MDAFEEMRRQLWWQLFCYHEWYRTEVVLARSAVVLRRNEELLARLARS